MIYDIYDVLMLCYTIQYVCVICVCICAMIYDIMYYVCVSLLYIYVNKYLSLSQI